MKNQIRAHVVISGKVQGVGYRLATQTEATRLGVTGWVKNLPDGRVEAVFEGAEDPVEEAIGWCYQGSPSATVRNIEIEYEEPEGLIEFETR
jgi:acylphosphatase